MAYRVVYKGGEGEIVEKKSRFIATVRPVESEEEATAFIAEMKKKYWDARHNCSAFVIGANQELTRCSDDDEPGIKARNEICSRLGTWKTYYIEPKEEDVIKTEKQLKKKELDLDDYLMQIRQMKKMGSFSSILKLIPGMNQFKDLKIDDKEFDRIEAIICSMTKQEKKNTKLLNASRRQRIAKGSGTTVQDINKFIKSFEATQLMMKKMQNNKGGMKKLMNSMNMDDLKNFKF